MRDFAELFFLLDQTPSSNAKIDAIAAYLLEAEPADGAWAVYFLAGQRPKRLVGWRELGRWAREASGLPDWLFEECASVVGDSAETIAILAGPAESPAMQPAPLAEWMDARILPLRDAPPAEQRATITDWWSKHGENERLVLTKLITGGFRIGVSKTTVTRAVARAFGIERAIVAQRLAGTWRPTPEFFERLTAPAAADDAASGPYPFYLASPLGDQPHEGRPAPAALGDINDWLAEWKWDGIRAQLIRRGESVTLWSRGDEDLTERFPEITTAAGRLHSDAVLDGELVCFRDGKPLPFGILQTRINRRSLSRKILREAPAIFIVYDVLEHKNEDLREQPQTSRRQQLEAIIPAEGGDLLRSEMIDAGDWEQLAELRSESRERGVEGIMLKRKTGVYKAGRVKGEWWKWKVAPLTVDAVLTYAQPGRGRRAGLLTDYTFGVWDDGADPRELVTIAKAYSGLEQDEIVKLDKWLRANTIERFGPVRKVEAHHVFELAFEGINASDRHRGGVALRFPRIARWRTDKPIEEADTLISLNDLLKQFGTAPDPEMNVQLGLFDDV